MAKVVEIINYLPDVLTSIREFQAIATAENPELTDLWTEIEKVFSDQYVVDATAQGVARYESILKLVPKATETLDERKFKILATYNEQLPYTYRAMIQRLETLCGPGGYNVSLDVPGYTVTVRVALERRSNYDAVEEMLENIVPVNVAIDLSLLYAQHSKLAQFRHSKLGLYTHDQIRNDEVT